MSALFTDTTAYRPFAFPWAVELTKQHESMHWVEDEIPLGDDVGAWKMGKVNDAEREFVTNILRMFTQSDVNVGQFYYDNLIPRFRNNEVRQMLGSFATREGTHQRAYALLNDTLGLPESDYHAFLEFKEMADKHEYMLEADSSTQTGLALSLAKGVFNEGVSLFASFAMLLNFQRRGLMMGMCKIVEWSIKDETKHVEGVAKLFRTMCEQHPRIVTDDFKKKIYEIARTIVMLEDAFIDLVYAGNTIEGLDKDELKAYIRYVADRRLIQLGLRGNFGVKTNPLAWLDWVVSATNHTNFFEGKVAEYEVAGLQGDWQYDEARYFTIATRQDCPYCEQAKLLLAREGHSYREVDYTDYDSRQAFFDAHGWVGNDRSVPKLWEVSHEEFMGTEQGATIMGFNGALGLKVYLDVAE